MGRDTDSDATLAQLLAPLLDKITTVAPEPEPEPEPEPRRLLAEDELMALIFVHLDPENLRVCEGIDFARLEILAGPREPEIPPDPDSGSGHADADVDADPDVNEADSSGSSSDPALEPAAARGWIGASWTDDIATVPAALLDRPSLDAAQRGLVARAARSTPATVNLRRLERELALRHLELFVRACQAQGLRLCRVITGKGVGSRGEPVLKRAVLEWCAREGRPRVRACAPELDVHGEWGVLVVELFAARPRGLG